MIIPSKRRSSQLLLGAHALALATFASAQTPTSTPNDSGTGAGAGGLEEIIVTANKVAEPVQKVAATINVVSAETLSELHVQSVQEIATVVGGLSLTRTSPSEQSISLRGIKMPSAGGSGGTTNTVESYLNDAPISVVDAFSTTFDIDQVEVLRGPQGTLRGRPSPSGALTITTQRGSFSDYQGYLEATASDHDGQNVQAAVGGPISDTLAFRVAGVYDSTDGTEVKDIFNGRENNAEVWAGRATLTWRPIEKLELNLMEHGLLSADRRPCSMRGRTGRRHSRGLDRVWPHLPAGRQDCSERRDEHQHVSRRIDHAERSLSAHRYHGVRLCRQLHRYGLLHGPEL